MSRDKKEARDWPGREASMGTQQHSPALQSNHLCRVPTDHPHCQGLHLARSRRKTQNPQTPSVPAIQTRPPSWKS